MRIVLVFGILFLGFICVCQNVIIKKDNSKIIINKDLIFYTDVSNSLSGKSALDAIKKKGKHALIIGGRPNFNEGDVTYWGYFEVHNRFNKSTVQVLELHNPHLDFVKYYSVDGESVKFIGQSGDRLRNQEKSVRHRLNIHTISLEPKSKKSFLFSFKRNRNNFISFVLTDVKIFQAEELKNNVVIGGYIGIMLVLFLLGFTAFIYNKSKLHLYFSIYVITGLMSTSFSSGLGYLWITGSAPKLSSPLFGLIIVLWSMLFILFNREFLQLNDFKPGYYKFVTRFLWFYGLLLVILMTCFILSESQFYVTLEYLFILLTHIGVAVLVFKMLPILRLQARLALIALLPFFIGISLFIFMRLGFFESEFLYKYSLFVFSTIQAFTYLIGIVYLIIKGLNEKHSLQLKLIKHEIQLTQIVKQSVDSKTQEIASVLHDHFGAQISKMRTMVASNNTKQISNEIDILGKELRDITHVLSPTILKFLSISEAIRDFVESLKLSSVSITFTSTEEKDLLSYETKIELYSMVKELINNSLKHSLASRIDIQIHLDSKVISITVEDNGCGFELAVIKKGMGLLNLESRTDKLGASLQIDSKIDKGTLVIIEIKIP